MNTFQTVPGLEEELALVSEKTRSLSEDKLFRQPLSQVLESVFAAPGKLIRPALVMLFGRFGPDYPGCADRLTQAAAVLELTHMASLIHDDIVDDAPLRRGRPTIQSRFGKDMAVYGGDYLLSCVLGAVTTPEMALVGPILSHSIADMCSGELSQYMNQFDTSIDENRYFMNISGKTAALFSAACEIGAALSGCTRYTTATAGRFGHSFGILFQLHDDLLDCLSEEENDGKRQGMDFINGVYTLPVVYSFADPERGPALRELAGQAVQMEAEEVSHRLRELITTAGGVDYTRWIIKQYRERAGHALTQLPTHDVKPALEAMLDDLTRV